MVLGFIRGIKLSHTGLALASNQSLVNKYRFRFTSALTV
jgi:hypothetical protein